MEVAVMRISDAPGTQALTVWTVRGRDASRSSLWEVARAVLTDHRPAAISGTAEVGVPGDIEGARALSFSTSTRRVTLVEASPSAALIDAAIDGDVRFDAVIVTVADDAGATGADAARASAADAADSSAHADGATTDSGAATGAGARPGARAAGNRDPRYGRDSDDAGDSGVLRPALLIARQLGIDVAVIALDGAVQAAAPREQRANRAERIGSVSLIDDDVDDEFDVGALRELMNAHGFDGDETPIVPVSLGGALAGSDSGLESLATLAAAVAVNVAAPGTGRAGPLFLPIEAVGASAEREALLACGAETPTPDAVVSGRLARGRVREGDEVEVVGFGADSRVTVSGIAVTGIEAAETIVDEAHAGEAVALSLRGTVTERLRPGQVLAAPGSARPRVRFEADAWLAPDGEEPSADGFDGPHDVSLLGTMIGALISLPEGAVTSDEDETLRIHVDLDSAMAVEVDQTFVIRREGDVVGTGQITGILDDA